MRPTSPAGQSLTAHATRAAPLLLLASPAWAGDHLSTGDGLVALGAALAAGAACLGAAVGQGRACAAALEGTARNPGAAKSLFSPMVVGMALMESLGIYGFIIAFMALGKIV
jgi:F-type H+-transporting ATPase subunit c